METESVVQAGEKLKSIAESYAMQTYDRSGTTRKAIDEWDQAIKQKFEKYEELLEASMKVIDGVNFTDLENRDIRRLEKAIEASREELCV